MNKDIQDLPIQIGRYYEAIKKNPDYYSQMTKLLQQKIDLGLIVGDEGRLKALKGTGN